MITNGNIKDLMIIKRELCYYYRALLYVASRLRFSRSRSRNFISNSTNKLSGEKTADKKAKSLSRLR
jgi:hypothetical protein